MSKAEAIMHYKAAVAIFKKRLKNGIISADEFVIINTITSEKHGISSCSIYRENCDN